MHTLITREDFYQAAKDAIDDMMNEIDDPMSKMLIPFAGTLFATKMKKKLFGEEEEEA